jgi:hypothetical protein
MRIGPTRTGIGVSAVATVLAAAAARAGGSLLVGAPQSAADRARKPLTLEAISSEPPIVSRGAEETSWRTPRKLTYLVPEGPGRRAPSALWEYDVETVNKTKLVLPLTVPAESAASSGGGPPRTGNGTEREKEREEKPRNLPFQGALWSRDGATLLLTGPTDLFTYDVARQSLRRLTNDAEEEEAPTFSPDGKRVAFVRGNDLWSV